MRATWRLLHSAGQGFILAAFRTTRSSDAERHGSGRTSAAAFSHHMASPLQSRTETPVRRRWLPLALRPRRRTATRNLVPPPRPRHGRTVAVLVGVKALYRRTRTVAALAWWMNRIERPGIGPIKFGLALPCVQGSALARITGRSTRCLENLLQPRQFLVLVCQLREAAATLADACTSASLRSASACWRSGSALRSRRGGRSISISCTTYRRMYRWISTRSKADFPCLGQRIEPHRQL